MAAFGNRLSRTRLFIRLASLFTVLWLVSGVVLVWRQYVDDLSTTRNYRQTNMATTSGERSFTREGQQTNFTDRDDIIIYNRIPKCASTSMRLLMKELAGINKFVIHSSRIYSQESLNDTGQSLFVRHVNELRRPLLFIRHVFFVDFSRYHTTQPIYINMIREPLERLVSDYYFKRYNVGYMFPMSAQDRDRTYDECVQSNLTECIGDNPKGYFRIIPYFCGQDPHCFIPSQRSLAQAKQNVEKHFIVVGVMSYIKEFLKILEKVLPSYFRGAPLRYDAGGNKYKIMARTKNKKPIESQTATKMKNKLRYDYDFYHFVKQRFTNQYKTLFGNIIS